MTLEEVNKIVLRYVENWNKSNPRSPLYLMATEKAGFHFGYGGRLIFVRTDDIAPESVLAAFFFHAYGQAEYERDRSAPFSMSLKQKRLRFDVPWFASLSTALRYGSLAASALMLAATTSFGGSTPDWTMMRYVPRGITEWLETWKANAVVGTC